MTQRKVTRGTPPKIARTGPRTRPPGANSARAVTPAASSTRERTHGAAAAANAESPNFLGLYFREMAGLGVIGAEEELRIATQIAELRRGYWDAMLAYAPFVEPIVALLEARHGSEGLPRNELEALRSSAHDLREHETRATRRDFEAACRALVERASELDRDGIVSDLVYADLVALAAGKRDGLNMRVNPPRQGSKPFELYVQRVKQARRSLRAAKDAFVKANLRLVVSIARRFNYGRMPLQDLIQEGNIGLMKAVDRFDPRKGFRFSTYGSWWIRHAISRAIADKGLEVRLPVHMLDAQQKLARARREFESLHGREPQLDELARHTGLASEKIERMGTVNFGQAISLDRPVSEEDGRRMVDFLEDDETAVPGVGLEAEALNEQVRELIAQLSPVEADILRKRFGLDDSGDELTLKQIGEQYSLSRERIRQLQERALSKLRHELRRREVAA
ncbi:sigma-70 family RNA polymerase sigma factor [Nannocystis radixulma]|uniref:RNA polymerase sigma factor n=1 Tax=Nannocystis radixulma TaxID=2995305 RepID=A0ABT5BNF1_9BACT|nr:sigma-70 family RNA polymerase sigma factor [Nannocystis radixulma]MDC0675701.1 sigma-70 family RNA polymerase sigma factor [Nannocystis radixulma]